MHCRTIAEMAALVDTVETLPSVANVTPEMTEDMLLAVMRKSPNSFMSRHQSRMTEKMIEAAVDEFPIATLTHCYKLLSDRQFDKLVKQEPMVAFMECKPRLTEAQRKFCSDFTFK